MNAKHLRKNQTNDTAESVLKQIRESETPQAIVNKLPPYDLLTVFSCADDEQRADLLAIADKEHVDLLVDLSCWPGDRPDMDKLEDTIKTLVASGLGGATRTLGILEAELTTLSLRRNVVVHLIENRNDVIDFPSTSEVIPFPDGFYFLEFPDPDVVTDTQRALFQALIAGSFENYQKELECIRHDMVPDLEERAYKWHNARLADFGFIPRHEAISLLSPRDAQEVRKLAANRTKTPYPLSDDLPLPVLYRENLAGNDFLDEVFERLVSSGDQNVRSRKDSLEVELTATLGTFLTAVGTDLGDTKAVSRHVKRARNLLALGLQETANNNLDDGVKLILVLEPAFFVQVGLGLLYPLSKRAKAVLNSAKFQKQDRPGQVFDVVHNLTLTSLAKDMPCFFRPALTNEKAQFDLVEPLEDEIAVFANRDELTRVNEILLEAELLESLLFDGLGFKAPLPAETPASILILTSLANATFGLDLRPTPLSLEEAVQFDQEVKSTSQQQFVQDAMKAIASRFQFEPEGTMQVAEEKDPSRRLVLRLVLTAHARLLADVPERALLTN